MQPDQNRETTIKDRGGLPQRSCRTAQKLPLTPICHTIKAGKAWEPREAGGGGTLTPVSAAQKREHNSHSAESEIVQPSRCSMRLHNRGFRRPRSAIIEWAALYRLC